MQASSQLSRGGGLLDLAREALVVLSPGGRVRFWNSGAEQVFGIPRDEAIGRPWPELLGRDAALPDAAIAELANTGSWHGELQCTTASGMRVTADCVSEARFDAQGHLSAIDCALADVTEQRRAEKEIVLLHKVMEQRIRKRTEELEQSNDDLRGFAYSLAHDLRAPLASIDGFSAQLEQRLGGTLDEKSRHYLQRVRAGVKLMADLTEAMLALTNVSHAELLHQRVDMSMLARQAVMHLRESQPHRNVTAVIHDTPPATGDVRLLANVLQNLVGNAWKFTSRSGDARIEFGAVTGPGGATHYFVKDNGAGFDSEYAYKLFGPFQRLHRQDEFEGTGIGLAMVRKIVSRHGGRVWAQSVVGEGATFYFTLSST
jgi:PAS domain S-box-containing protein